MFKTMMATSLRDPQKGLVSLSCQDDAKWEAVLVVSQCFLYYSGNVFALHLWSSRMFAQDLSRSCWLSGRFRDVYVLLGNLG